MTYEMIHRYAERLGPELHEFARRISTARGGRGLGEGASDLIEARMSTSLEYDLVFRDAMENIVGIMVGAGKGPAVLLRSAGVGMGNRPARENGKDLPVGLVSQVYAGYVLSEAGMFPRGTIVVSISFSGTESGEQENRYLLEHTLPSLNIDPGFAILSGESCSCSSHEAENSATAATCVLTTDHAIPSVTLDTASSRQGRSFPCGDRLVETTYLAARLTYRFLLG
ncbi:MAG TPA: hypothetical protein VLA34_13655 [Candidatus Krumholzibacterium sp.]|nr:hypothetical protein [Candidatus Krumholzibacterium sp.]